MDGGRTGPAAAVAEVPFVAGDLAIGIGRPVTVETDLAGSDQLILARLGDRRLVDHDRQLIGIASGVRARIVADREGHRVDARAAIGVLDHLAVAGRAVTKVPPILHQSAVRIGRGSGIEVGHLADRDLAVRARLGDRRSVHHHLETFLADAVGDAGIVAHGQSHTVGAGHGVGMAAARAGDRGAVAEVPGILDHLAIDVVAAAAFQHDLLADRHPPVVARDRDRGGVDLHGLLIDRKIAGWRRIVLDAQDRDVAARRRKGVTCVLPLAQLAVAELPEIAGDRPFAVQRATSVEGDELARRDHEVLPRHRSRGPLDEHLEITPGAGADLARGIAYPERRAIAARPIVGMHHGPTACAFAIAELPQVTQALAVRIGRARGVERDREAVGQEPDVAFGQRAGVRPPRARRQLDRELAPVLIPDLEGHVVRHLGAAAERQGSQPTALLVLKRDLGLAPFVLTRGCERRRAEGSGERDLGIRGIEVADGQPLGVLGHEESHLGDQILVGHPQAGREREDLEPLGRQVAVLAQAERDLVQVGVVARRASDLEAEDAPTADRLPSFRSKAHEGLPATILSRIGAEAAHGDLAACRKLCLVRRCYGSSGEGAIAAVELELGRGLLARAVELVVVAAAVRIEHPQEQAVPHALGHAEEDDFTVVGIAFRGRGQRPISDRDGCFLSHDRGGSEQGRKRERR